MKTRDKSCSSLPEGLFFSKLTLFFLYKGALRVYETDDRAGRVPLMAADEGEEARIWRLEALVGVKKGEQTGIKTLARAPGSPRRASNPRRKSKEAILKGEGGLLRPPSRPQIYVPGRHRVEEGPGQDRDNPQRQGEGGKKAFTAPKFAIKGCSRQGKGVSTNTGSGESRLPAAWVFG